MKRNKTYQVTEPKKSILSGCTFTVTVDSAKIPNKMHFDAQRRYPALVHADKRKKQPKHKARIYAEY